MVITKHLEMNQILVLNNNKELIEKPRQTDAVIILLFQTNYFPRMH